MTTSTSIFQLSYDNSKLPVLELFKPEKLIIQLGSKVRNVPFGEDLFREMNGS